ncbi:hypothetical protein IDM40_06035 [Nocardiopsis sp. HNM0947]|uniref:Uncharacterized protein n=1 Tax=Nocardiopsis coralli TaxID=2772213 RepID=A0ABR9P3F4_9ACTN|nr:hypothetical protein [Nocardiopsis coralli]MBE2998265.1 hypothetical protein [Nocardiopsis coralli]
MAETVYCLNWSFKLGKANRPMTAATARKRYEDSGERFTAVVPTGAFRGSGAGREPVILTFHWKIGYAAAEFMDHCGRRTVKHVFRRCGDDLFLRSVWVHTYPDDDPRSSPGDASVIESYSYARPDLLTHIVRDKTAGETVTTRYDSVDLTPNRDTVPAFGDWARIAAYERPMRSGS